MLFTTQTGRQYLQGLTAIFTPQAEPKLSYFLQAKQMSNLKVVWRKDVYINKAMVRDKPFKPYARLIKAVLNAPRQKIPLVRLELCCKKLRLTRRVEEYLIARPNLFDVYLHRIKSSKQPVRFVRPSNRLKQFLRDKQRIHIDNEAFLVSKLCKLLMMSKDRALSPKKLVHLIRDFGFPQDLFTRLVPKYPDYFQLVGSGTWDKSVLKMVTWNPSFAKSVIERRADEESESKGVQIRPNFYYKLARGTILRKGMREWVRNWLEMDYISPYQDASNLIVSSPEMEKRQVGVLHELLSLSTHKRISVSMLSSFREEYKFSNEFWTTFTRHSGIFYLSLKGGIKTAVLREAYEGDQLVDRDDPLLRIEEKFFELMEEGWQERADQLRRLREERERYKDRLVTVNVE